MTDTEADALRWRVRVSEARHRLVAVGNRVATSSTGSLARAVVVVVSMVLTSWWIVRDRGAPGWDSAHYLDLADRLADAFTSGSLGGFRRAIYDIDPSRGPFLSILVTPLFLVFGHSVDAGLILNVLLWPLLLLSIDRVATHLFDRRAGLLAMILAATMPLLVGLSHEVFQDFLLCAIAMTVVWLLLISDRFSRTPVAVAVGVVTAIGMLTKVTFPAFVLGPAVLVVGPTVLTAVREMRDEKARPVGLRRFGNLALAGGLAAALCSWWYLPNWEATREYLTSTTTGDLALGTGPAEPVSFEALSSFTLGVVNGHLSWVFALTGVGLVAWLVIRRLTGGRARQITAAGVFEAACLLAWVAVPLLSVGLSHNQSARIIAPAFAAFAVLLAGMVTLIQSQHRRRAVAWLLGGAGALQTLLLTVSINVPLLPDQLTVSTYAGDAVVQFDSSQVGQNRLPTRPDFASPVLDHLERVSREDGEVGPLRVGLLQTHRALNSNTLSFLSDARNRPFVFVELTGHGGHLEALEADLAQYDVIVFIEPVEHLRDPTQVDRWHYKRLFLLQQQSASSVVTPRLLAMFPADRERFPIGDGRTALVAAAPRT